MPVLKYWDVASNAYVPLPTGQAAPSIYAIVTSTPPATSGSTPSPPEGLIWIDTSTNPSLTPPPVTSTSGFTTYTDQFGDLWVAKGGVNGGAWKRPHDVLHCRAYLSTSYTGTAAAWNIINFQAIDVDAYGLFSTTTYRFTAPLAGKYLFTSAGIMGFGTAQSARVLFGFYLNGTEARRVLDMALGSMTGYDLGGSAIIQLNANDYVQSAFYESVGGITLTVGNGIAYTYFEASYLGTG
jgi:hypothetical protein